MQIFTEEYLEDLELAECFYGIELLHGCCHWFSLVLQNIDPTLSVSVMIEYDEDVESNVLGHMFLHKNGVCYDATGFYSSAEDMINAGGFDFIIEEVQLFQLEQSAVPTFLESYGLGYPSEQDYSVIANFITQVYIPAVVKAEKEFH